MEQGESRHNAGPIILSFFIGGLIGAGVALLLAPKSGVETRQRIKGLADEVVDKAEGYAQQVKGIVTSAVEKGKGIYDDKRSIVTAAVEAGREAYHKEKEKLVGGDS